MVEPPKDATGCEIPLTTTLLYDKCGQKVIVYDYKYYPRINKWSVNTIQGTSLATSLYLTPLDSWEKLEKDLDRCIEKSDFCMYFTDDETCNTCPLNELEPKRCAGAVFESIKMRIRNLKGETHDC